MKCANNGGRQIGNLPGVQHYLGNIPQKTNALFFIHRLTSHCNITRDTVRLCNSVARRQVSAAIQTVLLRWCMILMSFESLLFVRQGGLAAAISCFDSINNAFIVYCQGCSFGLTHCVLMDEHDCCLLSLTVTRGKCVRPMKYPIILFRCCCNCFKQKAKAVPIRACIAHRGSCRVPLAVDWKCKGLRKGKERI